VKQEQEREQEEAVLDDEITQNSEWTNTPENHTHWDHKRVINLFHDVVWCATSWNQVVIVFFFDEITQKSEWTNTPENHTHWDHKRVINLFHYVVWCATS
jgi:hypothetical protein